MDLIVEFINKVLVEDGSFTMKEKESPFDSEGRYSFVQERVGDAKFVYGERGYSEEFVTSLKKKFEILAIVAREKVYFINKFFFGFWLKDFSDYEKAEDFCSYIEEVNAYANSEVWPIFYENLERVETQQEKECRRKARKALLSANPEFWITEPMGISFNEQDVIKILCGLMSAEEEAKRRLEEDREDWCCVKARIERMKELMASPDELCQDWEIALAKGLNSVDAKNVTAEFTMGGNTASAKIEPEKILNTLMERNKFSDWDFATNVQGEKLFEALGATYWWEGKPLKCEHISKITYGKKVLYERISE